MPPRGTAAAVTVQVSASCRGNNGSGRHQNEAAALSPAAREAAGALPETLSESTALESLRQRGRSLRPSATRRATAPGRRPDRDRAPVEVDAPLGPQAPPRPRPQASRGHRGRQECRRAPCPPSIAPRRRSRRGSRARGPRPYGNLNPRPEAAPAEASRVPQEPLGSAFGIRARLQLQSRS